MDPWSRGIHGNEKADELAKKATSSGIILSYPLLYTDIYHLSTNAFNQCLLKFITNPDCFKGTFYIDNCFANSSKPWFHSRDLSRDQFTTFSRMRSKHLAFSLFRKNLTDSPSIQHTTLYPTKIFFITIFIRTQISNHRSTSRISKKLQHLTLKF